MINLNKKDSIEYISSGLFKSDGDWCHPHRTIDSYEIIFMNKGCAYICEDSENYTVKENDVLFLEPGKEHYGFRTSTDHVSFFWLHFITDSERYKHIEKHFSVSNPSALKTLFSQCLHTVNTPAYTSVCADLYTALIAEEILCCVISAPGNYLATQIKEYISLNTDKALTVKSIAARFGYHENHISRIFKETYGVLLRDYIADRRLAHARNLLHTTLYTVDRISQILSFKSENHFVKFFKYHTNITPTEYRNAYPNTHTNKS